MSKILIAEDDPFIAAAYKRKLTNAGFEIMMASDGVEALQILNDFLPDIILLDIVMPHKDGLSVLKELKAQNKWQKIPVIITSNLGQKAEKEKGLNLGADDYLIKSNIDLEDLIKEINSLVLKN